jgi:hypothetical protein
MTEQQQASVIADLEAPNAEEIKGGPTAKSKRIVVLQSSANGQSNNLDDLEPQGDVVGGQTREHILLARQVG